MSPSSRMPANSSGSSHGSAAARRCSAGRRSGACSSRSIAGGRAQVAPCRAGPSRRTGSVRRRRCITAQSSSPGYSAVVARGPASSGGCRAISRRCRIATQSAATLTRLRSVIRRSRASGRSRAVVGSGGIVTLRAATRNRSIRLRGLRSRSCSGTSSSPGGRAVVYGPGTGYGSVSGLRPDGSRGLRTTRRAYACERNAGEECGK